MVVRSTFSRVRTALLWLFIAQCATACTEVVPGTGIDATVDTSDARDASADGDVTDGAVDRAFDAKAPPSDDAGCPRVGIAFMGAACDTPGAECRGPRFMCYTGTAVGPVGLERCRCLMGRWECSNTCAEWQASLRDR